MKGGKFRTDSGPLVVGESAVGLRELLSLAHSERPVELDSSQPYRRKLRRGREVLEKALSGGASIYGVNTGVGASSDVAIPPERWHEMPANIMRFHGVGVGRILDEGEAASVVAVRLVSLAKGHSGVREVLLERLCELLNARLLPRIPEEGSVGASGDLTPLSYLAALVSGEREATLAGRETTAREALAELGLEPLELAPKESLSIMNGTSVMTALACLAWERAERFAHLAAAVTALAVDATCGNRAHYDSRIFELKPHPGQIKSAEWIRAYLATGGDAAPEAARIQDRYSLRCAPHVIGVLVEAVATTERTLEIELNSVDDNPLIDPDDGAILHGGNFYGGHVCFAMDGLKSAVANVADLLDRQLVLMCVPETSAGLAANLVSAESDVSQHGFKAMQITASALTAEALKLAMPASVFSRSTESHNQDKVSMGTVAARDCRRALDLAETVAVIALLAACQAQDLRGGSTSPALQALRDAVREVAPAVAEDRRQDRDIAAVLERLRSGALPLGNG